MNRRAFLGALAATAVAGCTSSCPPLRTAADDQADVGKPAWPAPHGSATNRGRAPSTWGPRSSDASPTVTEWELWEYRHDDEDDFHRGVLGSPVVGDQYVFAVDGIPRVYSRAPTSGMLFALDPAKSEPVWTKRLSTPPEAPPALVRGAVVLPLTDGSLLAVSQSDGDVQWRHSFDGTVSTPTVVDDRLYVGDTEGTVHALHLDGESCWSADRGPRIEGFGFGQRPSAGYKVAVDAATVYAIFTPASPNSDAPETGRLVALARDDGSERWRYEFGTGDAWPRAPAVDPDGETVYLPGGRTLHAIDTRTGEQRWQYAFGTRRPVSTPAIGDDRVYVCNKNVSALDAADGSEVWRFVNEAVSSVTSRRQPLQAAPAVAGRTVYAGLGGLSASTGERQWGEFGNRAESEYFSPTPTGGLAIGGPALSEHAMYASLHYGALLRFGHGGDGA